VIAEIKKKKIRMEKRKKGEKWRILKVLAMNM